MILEQLMEQYNNDREGQGLPPHEPWQVFDLIGGTSTGGIIAIMLGRLRMRIADCREAYESLAAEAFKPLNYAFRPVHRLRDKFNAAPEFDVHALEGAIRKVLAKYGAEGHPDGGLLKDTVLQACKVFVVCTNQRNTETELLRSYKNPKKAQSWYDECRILEACRATSAATTYFPAVQIQGDTYIDGGLLSNNPVQHVHAEAMDLWPAHEQFIISIGTGESPHTAFKGNLKVLAEDLARIATETHRTAETFRAHDGHRMSTAGLYYRFNVPGLGRIGLEEWAESPQVRALTRNYVNSSDAYEPRGRCVRRMMETSEGNTVLVSSILRSQLKSTEDFS